MRKFSRKAISTLLALAMMFSLFSATAYAQSPAEDPETIELTVVPLDGSEPTTYNLPIMTDGEIIPNGETSESASARGVPPQQQHTFNRYVTGMISTASISFLGDRLTSHVYVGNSTAIDYVKVTLVREYWYGSQEIVYTHVPVNTESLLFFSGLHISSGENYHLTVIPNVTAPQSPALVIVTMYSYYG